MSEVNKLIIRPSTSDDIIFLFNKLRKADIEEISLLGYTPLRALMESYIKSEESFTAIVNKQIAGMFGIARLKENKNIASIWFLGSDLINEIPNHWIKTGKKYINYFLKRYKYLTNSVSKQNFQHIKWLKLMGAKFISNENNQYFIQFYIKRRDK